MKQDQPLIFSVVGTFGSGKDTVGEYLAEQHGLLHVSSSDIVREESMKQHNSIERHFLLQTANDLRRLHGPRILAKMSFDRYLKTKDEHPSGAVFTGLRNVEGSNFIKERGGHIVFVDAPIETRYQRVQSRKRDKESTLTLDDFRKGEERELNAGPNEPNLLAVKDIATFHLMNNGTLEEFEEQIEAMLQTIQSEVNSVK